MVDRGSGELVIEGLVLPGDGVEIEELADALAGGLAEGRAGGGVHVEKLESGGGEGWRIGWRDDFTGIADDKSGIADIGGDGGDGAGHGFADGEGEGFADGGGSEDIEGGADAGDIAALAEEVDV
jgi:hypothetical protein